MLHEDHLAAWGKESSQNQKEAGEKGKEGMTSSVELKWLRQIGQIA